MSSFESYDNSSLEQEIPSKIDVWPFSVWEVKRGHSTYVPEDYKKLSADDDIDEDIDKIFYK